MILGIFCQAVNFASRSSRRRALRRSALVPRVAPPGPGDGEVGEVPRLGGEVGQPAVLDAEVVDHHIPDLCAERTEAPILESFELCLQVFWSVRGCFGRFGWRWRVNTE